MLFELGLLLMIVALGIYVVSLHNEIDELKQRIDALARLTLRMFTG